MFVDFFIRRPIFAGVCSVLIVLVGAIALPSLPIAQYPSLALPQVIVTAAYTGASSEVVESAVTQPLEQQINGVEGMKYISSTSSNDGLSQITVTFDADRNVDLAAVDVQNRVQTASAQLPNEVKATGITITKNSGSFVLALGLYSDGNRYDQKFLSNYADLYVRDALKRIKGVGEVQVFGERKFAMRLWLDPARLAARGLTANDVVTALREQNVQVAAGQVGQPPAPIGQSYQYSVRAVGRLKEPAEFENIILRSGSNGLLVRFKDVGRAELGAVDYSGSISYDGHSSVGLGILQLPGANALEVQKAVVAELERLKEEFPPGMHYEVAFDTTPAVRESISEVVKTLSEAILLVILVIFLFLQSGRVTLIPAVTIPVSLIGTFAFVKVMGFSINTLTLFGLTLATGLVVDDAIVVIENITRQIEEKHLSRRKAALAGMLEVFSAVVATSIVLIAVFVPVSFFPGTTGQIYRQFSLTIAAAVGISLFNSVTLTPALSALLLRHGGEQKNAFFRGFDRGLDALRRGYGKTLGWALRHRVVMIALFLGLIGATYALFKVVPKGFVPDEDQGYFVVIIQGPEGTSLDYTDKVLRQAEAQLKTVPEIAHIFAVGGFSFVGSGPNKGIIFCPLKPYEERRGKEHELASVIARVRGPLLGIPGAFVFAFPPPAVQGVGNVGGFQMEVEDLRGTTGLQNLAGATYALMGKANQNPKLRGVFTAFSANNPQLKLTVDRERAKALGVPLDEIFTTLQVFLGSAYVNDFDYGTRTYRVYVQADQAARANPKQISEYYVRTNSGRMIPLESVVKTEMVTSAQVISHYNLFRSTELSGNPAPGVSSGEALREMEKLAKETLPRGVSFEWSGLSKEELESGNQTVLLFALGLLFVFLVLAAQYESLTLPFVIILSVPVAIFGALIGQLLRGLANDVFCQVGLLMLIGLASKNAILIVEFAAERRAKGESAIQAVLEAAEVRLRPILMTSSAFLLGVLPLLVATGAGGASRQSLGTTVFFGMLISTVLNLYVIPVLYVLVEALRPAHKASEEGEDEAAAEGTAPGLAVPEA